MMYNMRNMKTLEKKMKKPEYYFFPTYMLHAPVSQTAKIVYMLLINRAFDVKSRNRKIGWKNQILVRYPLKELAEDCGRGITAMKEAVCELVTEGLIDKCSRQGMISEFEIHIPEENIEAL